MCPEQNNFGSRYSKLKIRKKSLVKRTIIRWVIFSYKKNLLFYYFINFIIQYL